MVEKNTILGIFYDEKRGSLCQIIKKGVPIPIEPWKKVSRSVENYTKLSYIFIYKDNGKKIEKKLDALNIKEFLRQRIKCPKHKEHTEKDRDHQFRDILAKGNSNRFYCKNHPDRPHNRYEFRFEVTEIYTLQKFLRKIGFFEILNKIHNDCKAYKKDKNKERYDIKKDEKELLKLFFYIDLSTVIIAELFYSSRPTITKLKRKILEQESTIDSDKWEMLKNVKVTSCESNDTYKRFFYKRVKVTKKHMDILHQFLQKNYLNSTTRLTRF